MAQVVQQTDSTCHNSDLVLLSFNAIRQQINVAQVLGLFKHTHWKFHCYNRTLLHKGCWVHQQWLASMFRPLNRLTKVSKWLLLRSIQQLVLERFNQSDVVAALVLGFIAGLQTAKDESR
jgi:hypothetical protein